MSFERPFLLCGWAPHGEPIRPQRYRDPEAAEHVVTLLRACGFQVALIPTVHGGPDGTDEHEWGWRQVRTPSTGVSGE